MVLFLYVAHTSACGQELDWWSALPQYWQGTCDFSCTTCMKQFVFSVCIQSLGLKVVVLLLLNCEEYQSESLLSVSCWISSCNVGIGSEESKPKREGSMEALFCLDICSRHVKNVQLTWQ